MIATRSIRRQTLSRRSLLAAIGAGCLMRLDHAVDAQNSTFPFVVDLTWLRARAASPGLRIVDVSPLHVHRADRIDAAIHAWWRDTVDPNYPVYGAVLTQGDNQAHRQRVLDSLQLHVGDDVVVYDNARGFHAARLVWFLRFLGFANAALLDSSVADWKTNPFPIGSTSITSTSPVVEPQPGFYLVTEQLVTRLGGPDLQLIDVRTDPERADDLDGAMPRGQIPGSIHLPWTDMLQPAGGLRSPAALRERTGALTLDLNLETVLYGRFGVDTALSWIALRNAGFANVLSYDRGWVEWSNRADLPQERLS